MKKKLSLFITLALASFVATGCEGLDEFLVKNSENQTEQKQEQQEQAEQKTEEEASGEEEQTIKVSSVNVQENEVYLDIDQTYQIVYSVLPAEANQEVIFDTEDDQICRVSAQGLLTPVAVGDTSIRLTSVENRLKFADINVHVVERESPPLPETNYTVSFNANGGTGTMASQTTNGSTFVVPSCSFTFTDHTFNGWALNSVDGTKYQAGSTISNITSNITLFATWSENQVTPPQPQNYTVTFNANGGSGTMAAQTTNGSTYVVPSCSFTYENHTFNGWALNSATGTKYSVESTISNISSNITLFATWETNQTTPPEPGEFDGYYSTIDINSDTLLSDLRTLNLKKRTSTISYGSLNSYFKYTDYDPAYVQYDENNQPYANQILSFYSGKSTTSYNKEHVWPNSRGGGSKGNSGSPYVENDIYMPRPTISAENSDRGNSSYVEGMCHTSNGWDPVTAFANNIGVYESIRGECARIIFYCMTVNAKLRLVDDANTDFAGEGGRVTMGKLSDMLRWNLENPVNEREVRRQSGGQYLQGNRNAFVDHPEYACKIWGNTNDATRKICGGN